MMAAHPLFGIVEPFGSYGCRGLHLSFSGGNDLLMCSSQRSSSISFAQMCTGSRKDDKGVAEMPGLRDSRDVEDERSREV